MLIGTIVSFGLGIILAATYLLIFNIEEPFFPTSVCIFAGSNVLAAHVETMLVESELSIDYRIQTISETLSLTVGTLS